MVSQDGRPHIIAVRTIIGYGSKIQNTSKAHGTPLGWEDIQETRKFYGLEKEGPDQPEGRFFLPQEIYDTYKNQYEKGMEKHKQWLQMLEEYKQVYPEDVCPFLRLEGVVQGIGSIDEQQTRGGLRIQASCLRSWLERQGDQSGQRRGVECACRSLP